ncbi:lipid-A-disaccharide synthase [Spirulina sp. 06S082]|uniref:lipid-A-disaccharide synthase n=1 Tax=Spirulina sp. 06S082 TaxID=3110248 RepID=UPI002B1F45D1|nr:lipid-A-disaccharide synthase [Spirulina sp. 06S082]MEA5467633.1 lipid-A-disaccharide synthase [Spirulina sp. 06S082]
MRIFISTGEVSGDLQGSLLIKALKGQGEQRGEDLEIVALGGDRMEAAGATLIANTAPIGSFGLIESLPFVWETIKIQRKAKQYLQQNPPDLVILIDYQDPNLAIGSYLRDKFPDLPIIYFIAPQAWIWYPLGSKVNTLVRITDRVLAIFPEEQKFYAQRGVPSDWVGHPFIDRIQTAPTRDKARLRLGIKPEQTAIALVPASRRQEIQYLLPPIFAAARQLQAKIPKVHFWIPLALEQYRDAIEQKIQEYQLQATVLEGKTLEILAAADLAITKSGTVNLELALLNVPQLVVYRFHPLNAWIARKIFNFSVPFISPVNLMNMEEIVPELFQEEVTPERICQEALELWENPKRRDLILSGYQKMRANMGELGVCDRAATKIFNQLSRNNGKKQKISLS